MGISAKQVKELRDRTGAGMLDCKKALQETDGDMDAAVEYLEKKGIAAAKKKSGRVAAEGLIAKWVNDDKTEAVLVEVNCETDFVARNDQFVDFVEKITDSVGESDAESADELDDVALVDSDKTVPEYVTEQIANLGENMNVRRLARRSVDEGLIGSYIHAGGQIGVLVQVSAEDDPTDEDVQQFARDVAMHIAAMNPPYLSPDEVPEDVLESQKEVYAAQMKEEGKPENIIPRIVEGKIGKWKSENSLLEQPFVKDSDRSVGELQDEVGGVRIESFVRYEVGEGIEKDEKRFDEEVAEQLGGSDE